MRDLCHTLKTSDKRTESQAIARLESMLTMTAAEHVQLLYSPDEKKKAKSFHPKNSVFAEENELVKNVNLCYAKALLPSESKLIPAESEIGKLLGGNNSSLSYWLYYPFEFEKDGRAALFLAFSAAFPTDLSAQKKLVDSIQSLLSPQTSGHLQHAGKIDLVQGFAHRLTGVSTRLELIDIVFGDLKSLIPFSQLTFFLLDAEHTSMDNFFWEESAGHGSGHFVKSVPAVNLPIDDELQQGYFNSDNIIGYDLDDLIHGTELNVNLCVPDVSPETRLLIPLSSGRRLIGYWILVFLNKETRDLHKASIRILIPHFTATILRIKMSENVERVRRDMDILEQINKELSTNKDKDELMSSLRPHLSKLFTFSHHIVAVVNNDKFTISLLLEDSGSTAKLHHKYTNIKESAFLINDQILNRVLLSNEPLVFDLEVLASRNALPQYLALNYESGVRKVVMVSLQIDGLRIGVWAISFLEHQEIQYEQLSNIKAISSQISIATRNLQNRETLRKQDRERELLTQVSAQIAMIRSRDDLDRILSGPLRRWLLFKSVSIMNFEDDCYRLFLQTIDPSQNGAEVHNTGQNILYPVSDPVMARITQSKDLVVYDLETLVQEQYVPEYIAEEYRSGIRFKIGFRLLQGEKISGAIFFNMAGNNYSDRELELLMNISLQVSAAVSHIHATEEIAERQRERELLFSLSTEIASVRDLVDLKTVITSKLKAHIGYSHLAICKLNDSEEQYSFFLFDSSSNGDMEQSNLVSEQDSFSVEDPFTRRILVSGEPEEFNLSEIPMHASASPIYVQINRERRIKSMTGIRLNRNGKTFGFLLMFFSDQIHGKKKKSELLNATANHIATAVYNIIANQQVKRLLDVRSQLLQFGIELRMVRDERILSNILKRQLKALFNVENFLVTALNEARTHHKPIFFDQDGDLAYMPEFQSWGDNYEDVSQGVFREILTASTPVTFDTQTIRSTTNVPLFIKLLALEQNSGFVGCQMKIAGETVGIILFPHKNPELILRQPELFLSILSQIAIVIANIQSHQKVQLQLQEIEKYKLQLEEEKIYLTNELETVNNYTEIVGQSSALNNSFHLVSQVAGSDSTVLILGETGTGKELIARAIHNDSPRKSKMMIKVNCAALPANLIESELFGHERGSFTGATDKRLGKFELANGSTLFLDEIGEMPLDLQVKLLRALQEKEVERVGGRGTIKVDVRIIAATNRNLQEEMEAGRFRSDLYYRLNIFPISLSPLRERKEDIEMLVHHFIQHFSKKCGKSIDSISAKALQDLQRYSWPGNVRELEHLIERSVLLANGNVIKEVLLPEAKENSVEHYDEERDILKTIDQNEKEHIYKVLKYCAGRIAGRGGAAEILGVPPTTLNSKIKRLGIKRGHSM